MGTDTELRDPSGKWQSVYGIDGDGAVLVRPDGYVAWRSRSGVSDPAAALCATFELLLGRIPAMA